MVHRKSTIKINLATQRAEGREHANTLKRTQLMFSVVQQAKFDSDVKNLIETFGILHDDICIENFSNVGKTNAILSLEVEDL